MRWLIFIALLISAVTASPLFHDVEAGNLQYRDRMIETRSGERYLTNAERLKRGLPLNKPHVRATRTQSPRGIVSPSPRAALIAVYRDTARTNLVGYLSYPGTTTSFPVDSNIANARTFTLPNQGPSTSNTINTGLSDRPFLASAYGTGTAPTSAGGPNRLVSSGNNYITFYASGIQDNGSPQTEAASATAAETSNWNIPDGTYGPITYTFVDRDGTTSTPNFYYKANVSVNLRAAINPTTASQNPRFTGNSYTAADQVYLSWFQVPPPPP